MFGILVCTLLFLDRVTAGPTEICSTIFTHEPTPAAQTLYHRGFGPFDNLAKGPVKSIFNDVQDDTKNKITKEAPSAIESVASLAESKAKDLGLTITMLPLELRDTLSDWKGPPVKFGSIPRDVNDKAVSTSGAERRFDTEQIVRGLPPILFRSWLVYGFIIFVTIMMCPLLVLVVVAIYLYLKFKSTWERIHDLWEVLDKAELIQKKIDGFQKKVEDTLKTFLEGKIKDDVLDKIGRVQDWLVESLTKPLRKIPGLSGFEIKKLELNGRGKRDLHLDRHEPGGERMSGSPSLPQDEERAGTMAHGFSLLTDLQGAMDLQTYSKTVTVTQPIYYPEKTELMSSRTPGPLPQQPVAVSFANSSSSLALPTVVSAGASSVQILPLFAILAQLAGTHQSHRHMHRAIELPEPPCAISYHEHQQVRVSAEYLCNAVNEHDYQDELARHVNKRLNCHANASLDNIVQDSATYCEESYNLATDGCIVLRTRNVQARDRFCEVVRMVQKNKGCTKNRGGKEASESRPGETSTLTGVVPGQTPHREAEKSTPSPASTAAPGITFTTQALFQPSMVRTLDTENVAPSMFAGERHTKTWAAEYQVFPIPPGYVAPSVVPSEAQVGDLTFYGQEGRGNESVGACGPAKPNEYPLKDNEFSVAIAWQIFDLGRQLQNTRFSQLGAYNGTVNSSGTVTDGTSMFCNRYIEAWTGEEGADKHRFLVRDRCSGCRPEDIDIRPGVFKHLFATEAEGRIRVTWQWLPEGTTSSVHAVPT